MQKETYKVIDGRELKIWIYMPDSGAVLPGRVGMIFIHGGGWSSGSPAYFGDDYKFFTDRGIVCFGVEYRLISGERSVEDSLNGVKIRACIEDCCDAVAYIRDNGDRFGINGEKIVVCGDSAGGHLALCFAATIAENINANAKANSVIAMNPIPDLTGKWADCVAELPEGFTEDEWKRRIESLKKYSPIFHIGSNTAPVLLLHGLDDKVVEPIVSLKFAEKYRKLGNLAELRVYSGAKHAFMLPEYTNNKAILEKGLNDMADFLIKNTFL